VGSCTGLHYNATGNLRVNCFLGDQSVVERTMDKNRLFWASRRGMLELDIILQTFLEEAYDELKPEEQSLYQHLLGCEDQDLFAWLMGRNVPEDQDTARIVAIIRGSQRAPAS